MDTLNVPCFDRLTNTRVEGEIIADILNTYPITGDEALESNIKSYKSPRILHLRTHGLFLKSSKGQSYISPKDNEKRIITSYLRGNTTISLENWSNIHDPLLCTGLALAGINTWIRGRKLSDAAEDGLLTAQDVTAMDLLNTELVVLSACDTALGEVLVGEGVFGLRRSFVLAGAQTLVMSLWKVSDKQTRELMVEFYIRLKKGQGRVDALREAQLEMKKKIPDPYFWGAFICQGNPSPLFRQKID